MKKYNQIKIGAMLSYIALILSTTISLVYTPFMVKTLGDGEYGIFTLVNSTIAYLTILGFGFEAAIVRYTTKYRVEGNKEKEHSLHGMFFIVYSIIGAVALVLGFILSYNVPLIFGAKLTPEQIGITKILMYLASVNVAVTFPFSIFASITTAYERFIFSKAMLAIKSVLNPLLMTLVLLLGAKSIGMILVATFITLFFGFINVIYCFKVLKIKFSFKGFDKPLLKEIIVFSSFIFLGMLVDRLYWNTGSVLLAMLQGAASITYFNLGVLLNNYYQQLSAAISNLFLPKVTAICSREHTTVELSDLMIKVGRIQFFVLALALAGFTLLGKMFFRYVWMGKEYESVYYIALTLFVPITVPLIQNIGISILQAKNKHGFRSVCYLVISICNIFMSIPLIKLYGPLGCAISIAISYTIGQIIIMNIYYKKVIGLDIGRFWLSIAKMLPAVIVPMGLELAFMQLVPLRGRMGFLVYGMVFVIVYMFCMLSFGLNKSEKKLLFKR